MVTWINIDGLQQTDIIKKVGKVLREIHKRPRLTHLGHFHGLFYDFGHFSMTSLESCQTPYFRFRKILPPSMYSPVTYSKPTSMKEHASFALLAMRVMNKSLGKFFIMLHLLILILFYEARLYHD